MPSCYRSLRLQWSCHISFCLLRYFVVGGKGQCSGVSQSNPPSESLVARSMASSAGWRSSVLALPGSWVMYCLACLLLASSGVVCCLAVVTTPRTVERDVLSHVSLDESQDFQWISGIIRSCFYGCTSSISTILHRCVSIVRTETRSAIVLCLVDTVWEKLFVKDWWWRENRGCLTRIVK